MKWMKFSKFNSQDEYAIPAERILSVHKATGDGCCIVTQEERGTLNTHVSQDYDYVVAELNRDEMEKRITERLAHHDHMGGVYQTRILRLEEKLEKLQPDVD